MTRHALDLIDREFGRLTAVEDVGASRRGQRLWLCRCTCGNTTTVAASVLTEGAVKSCGCQKGNWRGDAIQTFVGQRFGRLLVLEQAKSDGKSRRWLCRCDCGTQKIVTTSNLRRNTRSCGCLAEETKRLHTRTHGMSWTPLWKLWTGIRRRCNSPKSQDWEDYGGRGIVVFLAWDQDFAKFSADVLSEIGPRPSKKHSLDRKDNDGNYEPGNIRWATAKEQARNRRLPRQHRDFAAACLGLPG